MRSLNASIHILLVEDDEVDIQNMERFFKKNNIANPLHIAKNGLEALNKLQGTNGEKKLDPTPKIIILDISMPKMNGIELLQILHNDPELKSILVFILTASNHDKDKIAAYNLKVAGYILKPMQLLDFAENMSVLNQYWGLLEFPPNVQS
jgi:CheY-like chemotaxis protein